MDTLSHLLLGATIGQIGPARRAGHRATLAGATIALLPDVDVPIGHWLGDAAALTFHRGLTHSILFALGAALLLGWLLQKLWPDRRVPQTRWTLMATLVLLGHLLLDSFTSYGIQLLLPFTDRSFAIASISVIDPLYTLPLLIALLLRPSLAITNPWRPRLPWLGLLLSSAYLLLTLFNQQQATRQLHAGFQASGITPQRLFVKPTMFNSLLWRGIAETDTGYYVGFYSLRDDVLPGDFIYFPRHSDALAPYRGDALVRDLIKVSDGYYQAMQREGELYFHDLRYGQAFEWLRDDRPHVFTHRLIRDETGVVDIETIPLRRDPDADRVTLAALVKRAWYCDSR